MQELITIAEAAKLLDVTLSTVSYYIRTGKLTGIASGTRTAHRKQRKLISRDEVMQLKEQRDAEDAKDS